MKNLIKKHKVGIGDVDMSVKRSLDEINDSINKKRVLLEQTDWSDPKYDDMYDNANKLSDDMWFHTCSIINSID